MSNCFDPGEITHEILRLHFSCGLRGALKLQKGGEHEVEIVVDRLVVRTRLMESLETALKWSRHQSVKRPVTCPRGRSQAQVNRHMLIRPFEG